MQTTASRSVRRWRALIGLVAVLSVGTAAHAVVWSEGFDYDTTTPATDYPAFTASLGTGTAAVTGGELVLTQPAGSTVQRFTRAGFAMPSTVSTLVTATTGGGSYNVGLTIGNNDIVFHPGFGGGALRVEGPGGFGNTNMGFTPAANTLHTLAVTSDGFGTFDIKFADGGNPANVFTTSYTNPGAVGGAIGFRRSGPTGSGRYDDLTVSAPWREAYAETFDTDFQFAGANLASVGGELHLIGSGSSSETFTHAGPAAAYAVTGLVGADNSNGSYNVGMVIGGNNVVFHPGYSGGGLRVDGPGGFGLQNVGFTPANNVLHELQVTHDGAGNFTVQLTDGANPANVYATSFTNAGSIGGAIGFRRSGPSVGIGMYDDLSIVAASGRPTTDTFSNPFTTTLNGGSADVVAGVLELSPNPGGNSDQRWSIGSFGAEQLVISAEVGASAGTNPGDFNVGFQIGQNNIVFHPGYGGAALRVTGPGGFGNTNVGFTPALDTLHLLQIATYSTGLFEILLMDRNNPLNVFQTSFTNLGSVGGAISLLRSGGTSGNGLYDNLTVQVIPEPGTLSLLALGGAALAARRRRRRARG